MTAKALGGGGVATAASEDLRLKSPLACITHCVKGSYALCSRRLACTRHPPGGSQQDRSLQLISRNGLCRD